MTNETFKSGEWRICAICTSTIRPKDKIGFVWEEVACLECARSAATEPLDPVYVEDRRTAQEY